MKNRCVIVGGGVITNSNFLCDNISSDDFVIAADKGYDYCTKSLIVPDLIIGDFDSAQKVPQTDIETITLNPVKDCTDTEYAVNSAVKRGFNKILILGGLGNRLDHSYANLTLIASFKQKNVNITLKDENHLIYALKDESCAIKKADNYVSVFSYTENCSVTEKGFKYPLNKYNLSFFSPLGISNEVVDEYAEITINNGTAIVMEVNKNL